MLTELLILFVLLDQECTIYKIRKNIDKYFSLFHSASMGAIHPALQKLHANKCVNLKKLMSKGGQKSSIYSVTKNGRKYFKELMLEGLPENPSLSAQLAKIKALLLPQLEKSLKNSVISNLKDYYQNKLLDFENFQEEYKAGQNTGNININYIKQRINHITEEIDWLNFQELSNK